ncbi:MAG: hypothetical protein PHV45_05640 [Desulfuromonas thiophila]|nr:hypothetical protein [Desulfuromonas thiophila]
MHTALFFRRRLLAVVLLAILWPQSTLADSATKPLSYALRQSAPPASTALSLQLRQLWLEETEYLPELGQDLYRWQERSSQLQLGTSLAHHRIGAGLEQGTIEQKSLLFGDNDFSLNQRAAFVQWQYEAAKGFNASAELRCEHFTDRGDSGFYRLNNTRDLWTGTARLHYQGAVNWLSLSYQRQRDPEPVYNIATERAELHLGAQQLSGLLAGWLLRPGWHLTLGAYYEDYATDRPDQINSLVQLSHQPGWLPRLEAAVGLGYFDEEQETIVNLTLKYSGQLCRQLRWQLEYQLEYSDLERSWLNEGLVELRWNLWRELSASCSLAASNENGDDRDQSLILLAGLEIPLF